MPIFVHNQGLFRTHKVTICLNLEFYSAYQKMNSQYREAYQKFTLTYGGLENWPSPYNYYVWFMGLCSEQQPYYFHCNNYAQLHDYASRLEKQSKPKKLTRCQKRKIKKKELQEQFEQEKKEIGNWVYKERKDLIQGLEKIETKQKKIKEKKQSRLSNLIQIHKEVHKFHLKKNANSKLEAPHRKRVSNASHKHRITMLKKIKLIYEDRAKKDMDVSASPNKAEPSKDRQFAIQKHEADKEEQQYEDMSDSEGEQIEVGSQPKTQLPTVKEIPKEIEYKQIGKLSNVMFNNIRLREWVTNVPTRPLQELSLNIINRLAYKQAIKKVKQPQKAKKLIVSGLHECKRTLTTTLDQKKSKALIVALNVERNNLEKGTDDLVQSCIEEAQKLKIPIIHASTRSKLGRAFTGKFGPRVSVVSIVNYEGYQDFMQDLLEEWRECCQKYLALEPGIKQLPEFEQKEYKAD